MQLAKELTIVELRQALQDEIERLKVSSNNPFLVSSEQKIELLEFLFQLITSPESFDKKTRQLYFGENLQQSISFDEIVSIFLAQKNIERIVPGVQGNYTNQDILFANRTPAGLRAHSAISSTESAMQNIRKRFGSLQFSLQDFLPQNTLVEKPEIAGVDVMGDSLSDLGKMLATFMAKWSGIKGVSPQGSFTNGFCWPDFLNNELAQDVLKEAVLTVHPHFTQEEVLSYIQEHQLFRLYELNQSDKQSQFKVGDIPISRSYAIGGLTSHNYFGEASSNLMLTFARAFLSNLDEQRKKLLQDNEILGLSKENISKRLLIEWSGANDLITVNQRPTIHAADLAVEARMENIEKLIAQGYENVVLPNLPDLSLVPRYQHLSLDEQKNAKEVADHFNRQLAARVKELQQKYPHASLHVFNINASFRKMLHNRNAFGFNTDFHIQEVSAPLTEKMMYAKDDPKEKDNIYVRFSDGAWHYQVIDCINDIQEGRITLEDLNQQRKKDCIINYIKENAPQKANLTAYELIQYAEKEFQAMDEAQREQIAQSAHFSEVTLESFQKACPQQEDLLQVLQARGHIERDPLVPLKSTQAFIKKQKSYEGKDMELIPGRRRFFYDDVHPASDVYANLYNHALKPFIDKRFHIAFDSKPLVEKIKEKVQPGYSHSAKDDFSIGNKPLSMDNARVAGSSVFKKKLTTIQDYILAFAVAHKEQFIKDRYCFFGISKNFRKTNVQVHAHTTLSEIITHAQKENNRSRKVLQQLGWIDKECNVISPDIMRLLQQEREKGKERVIGQVAPK